jgi:hypothetical protein
MNGIHVIDLSKSSDIGKAIDEAITALLGGTEESMRTVPLRDKSQQDMRDILFKQGDELNEKCEFLKRILNLTADLIDLINEDHIKEDGLVFLENRAKQAAVTKKMIEVMDQGRKADKANGAAGR